MRNSKEVETKHGHIYKDGTSHRYYRQGPSQKGIVFYKTGGNNPGCRTINQNVTNPNTIVHNPKNNFKRIDKTILYPNPANSFITISSSTAIERTEIYNEAGMLLRNIAGNKAIFMSINIEKLPDGVYFCKVFSAKEYEVLKLIVKR